MRRLLLSLCLVLLCAAPAFAQETPDTAIAPELAAQMDRLERFTTLARRLDRLTPVPREFPSRDEVRVYLRDLYTDELAVADLERAETFYKALWLLPSDTNLGEVVLNLLGSQVAGFYDTETQIMNVIPTISDEPGALLTLTEQIIFVHEFTHALQDQHFDLNALLNAPETADQPDRSLAALSLIEGDATATMNLYMSQVTALNPNAALSLLAEGLLAGNLFLPPDIPTILGRELAFPYEQGLIFVLALWDDGGWERVDKAYTELPTTTEQIIHPEKYLSGEGALPVEIEDISAALGDGWAPFWTITLGEFYLSEHLRVGLPAARAAEAAAGWGGDMLRLYQHESGALAWHLALMWDTPADAAQFEAAYLELAESRYGRERVENCWRDDSSSLCLNAADGVTSIQYIEAVR
jgi:hypothetical protein